MSEQDKTVNEFAQNKKSLLQRIGTAMKSKGFLIGLPIGLAAGFCVSAPAVVMLAAILVPGSLMVSAPIAVTGLVLTGVGISSAVRSKNSKTLVAGLLVGALGSALVGVPLESAVSQELSMNAPSPTVQMASAGHARLPVAVPTVA